MIETINLQNVLERQVRCRTGHRIRDLDIDVSPERIVLRGRATSYYVKQLAQHGVRDILPLADLDNTIDVDCPPPAA